MNSQLLSITRLIFLSFILCLPLFSCGEENKVLEEVERIPIDLKIVRFDRELAETTEESLPQLKKKFPYLFPAQFPDSIWVQKLHDTIQIELLEEVGKAFPDFKKEKEDLESLFKHIKYYFPKINAPEVLTVISKGVDYENRIILTDSLLLIALDNYLGADHRFYQGMNRYIAKTLDERFLTSDVAGAFANKVLNYPNDRTFLSKMIYYGKELYLKDKLLPHVTDAQKIGYSQEEYDWAQANEDPMWRYFIERELLYSTDNKLEARFLDLGPFSKFGLELIDGESPSKLGRYMGWQIVRAYMDENDLTLQQLLHAPAEEIFRESNYKPKK